MFLFFFCSLSLARGRGKGDTDKRRKTPPPLPRCTPSYAHHIPLHNARAVGGIGEEEEAALDGPRGDCVHTWVRYPHRILTSFTSGTNDMAAQATNGDKKGHILKIDNP